MCIGKADIKELKLMKNSEKVLLENENAIISSIDNCSFSDNGSVFLVSSITSKDIILYNTSNCEIIEVLTPPQELSDSLVSKTTYFRQGYDFVAPDIIRASGEITQFNNTYKYAEFINDSVILICANVHAFCVLKDTSLKNQQMNRQTMYPMILYLNINNGLYSCDVLDSRKNNLNINTSFAQANKIKYNKLKNEIYAIHETPYTKQDSLINELIAIGANSINGDFKYIVHGLPDFFIKSKLKYSLFNKINMDVNSKGELLVLYPYIDKVYNVSLSTDFDLSNLPTNNRQLFEDISGMDIDKINSFAYMDSLLKNKITLFTNSLYSVAGDNILTLVTHSEVIKSDSIYNKPILQLYNFKCKIIAENHILLYRNKNGVIKHLHYSKANNRIWIFRKNENNWIVEAFEINY